MIGDMYSGENFGMITIDTLSQHYEIELKDLDGNRITYKLIDINKGA